MAEGDGEVMVSNMERYFAFACGWLAAVAVLTTSQIAQADPVHMECSGGMLLPGNKVDTNSVLSLTIDLRAGTVTVGGYQPVGILDTESNEVSFLGSTMQGVLLGHVDRVTGSATITFQHHTPQEQFFSGICRPAQKLF